MAKEHLNLWNWVKKTHFKLGYFHDLGFSSLKIHKRMICIVICSNTLRERFINVTEHYDEIILFISWSKYCQKL